MSEQIGQLQKLVEENQRYRQALDASRDKGLAYMVNWMRGRALAALLQGEG